MDRTELQAKIEATTTEIRRLDDQAMELMNRQAENWQPEDEQMYVRIEESRQTKEDMLKRYNHEMSRLDLRSDREAAEKEAEERARLEASRLNIDAPDTDTTPSERSYLNEYLLTGIHKGNRLGGEQEFKLRKSRIVKNKYGYNEVRAQSVGTNTEGGYWVRDLYFDELIMAMKQFNPVMEVARIIQTATGGDFVFDTVNDTNNKAVQISEAAAAGDTSWATAQVTMNAYKFTTNIFKLSTELVEDSAYDPVAFSSDLMGERLGRGYATVNTHGSGTNGPEGFVKALTSGSQNSAFPTDLAANVSTLTTDNLWDLEGALDPAYRRNAMLIMSPKIETVLKKLSIGSSDARPLWVPDLTRNSPGQIMGYNYVLNADMTDLGTQDTGYAATDRIPRIVFGDMSSFFIRLVNAFRTRRLDELYAATDQIGLVGFGRMDSKYINAGTNPLVALRQIRG